ncbi:MAG TPA: D-2-hydroxyacid dehydrogenase [Vicinamibacteria bacterium]|nr:D-2-hydroxyacid dehydrogenase [Vicinamibacteria bacterium]
MSTLTVYVLARADDAGLLALTPPPPGVRFVVGDGIEAFSDAPAADVVFACGVGRKLLEPLWERCTSVRWVHSRFAGLDGFLFPALVESAVPLTNGRGSFSRSLGEFVVAGLLYFAKDFTRMRRSQAAGSWDVFDVEELHGRTLGIVGYGDIGRAIAERARPFGMRIVGLRRRPEREAAADGLVDEVWPLSRLRELMATADDIAVALPLTPDTHHLIGEAEIRALSPRAVFANVGRGAVVDEPSLVRALEEKRIKGAVLDVFETEPLPKESPLWRLDNVLLSAHTADHTSTWLADASGHFLANLDRFRRGEPLLNLVDKRAGY